MVLGAERPQFARRFFVALSKLAAVLEAVCRALSP